MTREARDASGEVHDRMPVFLEHDVWDEWLHPEKLEDPKAMVAMIDASSQAIAATVTTHLVSRAVNNVRTVDPALIRSI
ncbi:SOS response-associated peptidase family protein [Sanguibacter sp. 25GB23B1]|uniref:SOS response-associated peptidase family protein n=1 Tax=Sanguibacter sp. 25GB23B1 TaxID=3156067 RepID=UPI0032AF1142